MMMFKLRDVIYVGYDMTLCTHAAFHNALQRHYSREAGDFDNILFQICWSTGVLKIIKYILV